MTTLTELRNRTFTLLGNPTGESVEDALVLNAIGAAFDAILPWVPKVAKTSVTGDGTVASFDLPTDFYNMDAVIVQETGEALAQAVFAPGQYFGSYIEVTNTWYLSPSDHISFAKALGESVVYDLYYCATWAKPTSNTQETEVLEPPSFLEYALALYTAAYILMPDMIGLSSISAYKTRVDSGNPEHNPAEKTIDFLMKAFNQELNRHPRHQKGQV